MGIFKNNDQGFIIQTEENEPSINKENTVPTHAITPEEISLPEFFINDKAKNENEQESPLEMLKRRMGITDDKIGASGAVEEQDAVTNSSDDDAKTATETKEQTLLEKMHRYTVDEQGRDLSKVESPLYKLESVTEILKSDGEKALESLSKKYNVSFDDLSKGKKEEETKTEKPPISEQKPDEDKEISQPSPTPAFEKMVSDAEENEAKLLFDELFNSEEEKEKNDFPTISIPDISDIDNSDVGIPKNPSEKLSDTATIRFTPIKDSKGNTDHIVVSSITKHIDLSGETNYTAQEDIKSSTELQQTEFDMFVPKREFESLSDAKKIIRALAINKRNGFMRTVISAFSTLAVLIFAIPAVYDNIISNPKASMIICGIFLLISVTSNGFMFADFKGLFKKKCSSDVMISLASVFTIALTITAIITHSNAYYSILLNCIILLFRSYFVFKDSSVKLSNLKQIANSKPKKAVNLISDSSTTFAMAKNTIEGDILIATPRRANFIEDFMKHSDFGTKLSGKLSITFYLTLILSVVSCFAAYFYYDNIFDALYCSATIALLAAMPTLYFIDSLPLATAAKKLNAKGAMIAGMAAAEKLEFANAAVISTADIFPEGAITMHSMKVLSDNNIDETLMRAASLTKAMESPLAPIFEKIAGTNTTYSMPDSDTVKYEKRQGISGWVDNELLLIGNRTLMEARGIEIPSVEFDKQILRKGYFPVYVSTDTKACALLIIQYNVRKEIAKELHRITNLGVTLLIDNCDPNVNEDMICDYFGLYEDSVKVMSNVGMHMYRNASLPTEKISSPAAYRGSNINFISIMNCASRIKKSNSILAASYIITSVLSVVYFIYASFSGAASMPEPVSMLVTSMAATLISALLYLIKKP